MLVSKNLSPLNDMVILVVIKIQISIQNFFGLHFDLIHFSLEKLLLQKGSIFVLNSLINFIRIFLGNLSTLTVLFFCQVPFLLLLSFHVVLNRQFIYFLFLILEFLNFGGLFVTFGNHLDFVGSLSS